MNDRFGLHPTSVPEMSQATLLKQTEEARLQPGPEPLPAGSRYVSYAWANITPGLEALEQEVDQLCDVAKQRGYTVHRDRTAMRPGDDIRLFMKRIGAGERIYVFISEKYLKSENCMFELLEIWRTSKQEAELFRGRIRCWVKTGTPIFKPEDKLKLIGYWAQRAAKLDEMQRELPQVAMAGGVSGEVQIIHTIAGNIGNMLPIIADTLLHVSIDELIEAEFSPQW
jgi:internalin A